MTDLGDGPAAEPTDAAAPPLCVDLDGTLVATDTLHEALLAVLKRDPLGLLKALPALGEGKAAFKRRVTDLVRIDAGSLPYRPEVLAFLEEERARGTRLVLATASDERTARDVADHLGIFDAVVASDGSRNEKGSSKAASLRALSDDGVFDYMGDSAADLPVWAAARNAYAVAAAPGVLARLDASNPPTRVFPGPGSRGAHLVRALRPHQWAKNLLLFVPLLTSHQLFDPGGLIAATLGFIAFSAMASAGYVLNDLLDVEADRAHPVKRERPFAAADLTPRDGGLAFAGLTVFGLALALAFLPLKFVGLLVAYFVATVSYSVYLKSKLLLDVILLAGLYTLRVLAGGAAVGVVVSQWLLSFSMYLFLSLAFAKRYSELKLMHDNAKDERGGARVPGGRNGPGPERGSHQRLPRGPRLQPLRQQRPGP